MTRLFRNSRKCLIETGFSSTIPVFGIAHAAGGATVANASSKNVFLLLEETAKMHFCCRWLTRLQPLHVFKRTHRRSRVPSRSLKTFLKLENGGITKGINRKKHSYYNTSDTDVFLFQPFSVSLALSCRLCNVSSSRFSPDENYLPHTCM